VGLDTIVMGPAAKDTKHKYIQVFIDHFSRFIWAFPTANNTSETIVTLFRSIFTSGLKFQRILTDCHKNFSGKPLKDFLHDEHIKHTFSTPYHPQTNGIVERANGTIITKLRAEIMDKPHRKWSTLLKDVINNYNNTPHDITGFSPQFLLFGKEDTPSFSSQTDIITARQIAIDRTNKAQHKRKSRHDLHHPKSSFNIGDRVIRIISAGHPSLTKTTQRWTGPYFIINKLSEVTFDIAENLSDKTYRAHSSQLKRFIARQQT